MDWNWLPRERQWISINRWWHKSGQKTLTTHLSSFHCTTHYANSFARVSTIWRQKSIIPLAQCFSKRVHLKWAFRRQWAPSAWPFVIYVGIVRIRSTWTTIAVTMDLTDKLQMKFQFSMLLRILNLQWPQIELFSQGIIERHYYQQMLTWPSKSWIFQSLVSLWTISYWDFFYT